MASVNAQSGTGRSRFMVFAAIARLFIAVSSFTPTYFLPLFAGTFIPVAMMPGEAIANLMVHAHAFLLFGWVALFLFQSWLVATKRVRRHRAIGMAGISLATLLVVATISTAIRAGHRLAEADIPVPEFQAQMMAGSVPFDILAFAIFFIAAIANVSRPDWHGRLMLLATISLIGAPMNRYFAVYAPVFGQAFQVATLVQLPVLLGDLLVIPAMLYDWKRTGRVHPAYAIGFIGMTALHILVRLPLAIPIVSSLGAALLAVA